MGRIKDTNKYPYDLAISGDEYLIGSDADANGQTKNYKLSTLAAYFTQYFSGQNQNITLLGEIAGGNGVIQIPTTAQPSLISNKPEATVLVNGGKFLYLEDGVLKQIDAQKIIEGSGYVPPTYPELHFLGGGLEFMSELQTNTFGVITGGAMRFIQDSTETQKGVIRIADPSEYNSNLTNVALPPAAIQGLTGSISGSGTAGTLPVFVSSVALGDSLVKQNGTSIGVGTNPTPAGERLQIDGEVLAAGYRTPSNDPASLLNASGVETVGSDEIVIAGGQLTYETLNLFTGNGPYTIPDSRNKTIYVTYDGTNAGGLDSVTLPIHPIVGQRIYLFHASENITGTITVHTPTTVFEFDPFTGFIFYYNGLRWLIFSRLNVNVG